MLLLLAFGFVLGACWLGVGWNVISNCTALVVLGTIRDNEDDKRAKVQSVFDFCHYISNAFFVFIVTFVFSSEGWIGVLYTTLVIILIMIVGGLYAHVSGLARELNIDQLFEEGGNEASQAAGANAGAGAVKGDLERGSKALYMNETVSNPMVASLDEKLSVHSTGSHNTVVDSTNEGYSSMGEGKGDSKSFRASLAAQFTPGRLPNEQGINGNKVGGDDVELATVGNASDNIATPKASHSSQATDV